MCIIPLFPVTDNSLFQVQSLIPFYNQLLWTFSVTVLTFGMAFLIVDVAATSSTGVSRTPWTPAGPSGDPADLSVTDSAAQPITSVPLLHNDAALGTVHCLP